MRFIILLLLVTATSGISAQQLLFDKTIPEQNVPTAYRLKNEMRSHYLNSRYVSQTDFLLQQDLLIAISSNLIVRSKFIRMHSYPSGSFSYEGRLEGPTTGYITFSKYNDRTAGMIVLADGRKYMIDQVASDIFAISLSNESAFTQRESHSDFIEVSGASQPNAAGASICDMNSTCPGSSTIDMMVVYTQQTENNWGGAANTIANITQAVTNMNISMANSGIYNVTFRLVHTTKVTYAESGNFSTDLTRLAANGDGYMDNVHALRDQYGADLVSLVIGSPASSCGIGYLNTNPTSFSADNAFNVSLYSCVVGNFTMAHECGHNMGLRHDWYVDASTSPCSHQHGYVNETALAQGTSSPSSSRWRTIMAYNDRCAVAGFDCTRINMWANPDLTYNGDPAGKAIGNSEASDEAYAFYRMACLVAAFRSEASGGGTQCSAPSGLSSSGISTSAATLIWSSVNGAISYDVDYKPTTSSTWINAATGTPSSAIGLGGLTASLFYDWRVRANCSSGSSVYAQTTFSTLSQLTSSCNAPTGLSTSGITASAATANWAAVSGAVSYNVDYKLASSTDWITIANGTTSLSWTIGGMQPTTSYDWRVSANCASGISSYTQTEFTTQAVGSCSAPGGLSTTNITSSTATMNWSSVTGAFAYSVQYKATSSGTWLTAASATYSTSYNLYGLSAATSYDWRVVANCSLTEISNYSTTQFTTSGSTPPPPSSNCPGPYDVSTNGSIGGAAAISLNTDVKGTVSPKGDIDHYKFQISSAGTVTVSLTTLPANYNLAVLNSNGTQIAVSQNNGLQNETISLNVAAGSYYAKVFPKGNANNATSCYTLRVQTGTATDVTVTNDLIVKLFPNPASNVLNIWMEGMAKNTEIKVYDRMGKLVLKQGTANTLTQLNISKLPAGFYLLSVNDGKETKAAKFVKE